MCVCVCLWAQFIIHPCCGGCSNMNKQHVSACSTSQSEIPSAQYVPGLLGAPRQWEQTNCTCYLRSSVDRHC